MEESKER